LIVYVKILDIIEYLDRKKHSDQKIFIININNYAYLIPFTEDKKILILAFMLEIYKKIKIKTAEKGFPYQTLIRSVFY